MFENLVILVFLWDMFDNSCCYCIHHIYICLITITVTVYQGLRTTLTEFYLYPELHCDCNQTPLFNDKQGSDENHLKLSSVYEELTLFPHVVTMPPGSHTISSSE